MITCINWKLDTDEKLSLTEELIPLTPRERKKAPLHQMIGRPLALCVNLGEKACKMSLLAEVVKKHLVSS